MFSSTEIDPKLATTPSGPGEVTYGKDPPKPVDLDDLCPPLSCPECPAPTEFKCHEGGIALYNLIGKFEIKPLDNETNKVRPTRILGMCVLFTK
jgi:hypothetical protein